MSKYDFDQIVDRKGSDSAKWGRYPEDMLPMWVADMDFLSPPEVLEALHQRIDHGVFGYGNDPAELREVICQRMLDKYHWEIKAEDIVFLPGLVAGFNIAARAIGERGDGVLVCAPVYFPFLTAPENQYRQLQNAPLATTRTDIDGLETIRYEMDMDAFDAAITPDTKLHILCNPHNPVGREFTKDELMAIGKSCIEHDLIICSDEIHGDLMLDGTKHVPIASLDPDIAERTITLMAPSKTFNLPGLGCSFAIITNPELREKYQRASAGIVPHVGLMGYVATKAAYQYAGAWESQLLDYLTANRDFIADYVRNNMPSVAITIPEATYLMWMDFNKLNLPESPQDFFMNEAKIVMNEGSSFGDGGEGFARFNFGCPRSTVKQGLDQIAEALQKLS